MGLVRHPHLAPVRRFWQYAACLSMALFTASCASRQLPLNLVEDLNNDGLAWRDEAVGGNFDRPQAPEGAGAGAYPAELLPSAGERIAAAGWDTEFVFPGRQRGALNNFTCESQRFKVPAGRYRSLAVLGASDSPGEKAMLRHRSEREEKLIGAMGEGPQTREELLPVVYDDVAEELQHAASRSLLAGLVKLAEEERVTEESDGRWRLR